MTSQHSDQNAGWLSVLRHTRCSFPGALSDGDGAFACHGELHNLTGVALRRNGSVKCFLIEMIDQAAQIICSA